MILPSVRDMLGQISICRIHGIEWRRIKFFFSDMAIRFRMSSTWTHIGQEVSCWQPSTVLVTAHSATDVIFNPRSVLWELNSLPAHG